MNTKAITNSEDVIDSRDVIARIEELRGERDSTDGWNTESFYEDERNELTALEALADEAEGYAPDWQYGETLIRDSYFETYARELAEDLGAIPKDLSWPACHIDWDAATEALKQDYTSVDFGDVTYWVRS